MARCCSRRMSRRGCIGYRNQMRRRVGETSVATLDYSNSESEADGNDDAVPHAAIGFAITPLMFGAIAAFAADTGKLAAAGGCVALIGFVCFPAGIISLAAHAINTRKKLIAGPQHNYR